jgi:hypothetical protein
MERGSDCHFVNQTIISESEAVNEDDPDCAISVVEGGATVRCGARLVREGYGRGDSLCRPAVPSAADVRT